jgi:hypothetical protein
MPIKQITLIALSTIAIMALVWIVATSADVALNESGTELVSINVFGGARDAAPIPSELSAQKR